MEFSNPDFVIKTYKEKSSKKEKYALRRYKGKESVVTIPDGVNKICDFVFADDIEPNETIEKIIIPDSVEEIYCKAFSFCKNLRDIRFPANLKKFHVDFLYCPSVSEVFVPESVKILMLPSVPKSIQKMHFGDNVIAVEFFYKRGKNLHLAKPQEVAGVLLGNPAYEEKNGFIINTVHKMSLFRIDFSKSEVRVPECITTIGPNTFNELYLYFKSEMTPVERVIIPTSVKKLNQVAFFYCNSLKEVVYEGLSENLEVDKMAFISCTHFHSDEREIICSDTPKPEIKKSRTTNLRIERIILIHRMIKSGCYPNKPKLLEECEKTLGEKISDRTIGRDMDFLRNRLNAPIKYDYTEKGFYYTDNNFTLNFENMCFSPGDF